MCMPNEAIAGVIDEQAKFLPNEGEELAGIGGSAGRTCLICCSVCLVMCGKEIN